MFHCHVWLPEISVIACYVAIHHWSTCICARMMLCTAGWHDLHIPVSSDELLAKTVGRRSHGNLWCRCRTVWVVLLGTTGRKSTLRTLTNQYMYKKLLQAFGHFWELSIRVRVLFPILSCLHMQCVWRQLKDAWLGQSIATSQGPYPEWWWINRTPFEWLNQNNHARMMPIGNQTSPAGKSHVNGCYMDVDMFMKKLSNFMADFLDSPVAGLLWLMVAACVKVYLSLLLYSPSRNIQLSNCRKQNMFVGGNNIPIVSPFH